MELSAPTTVVFIVAVILAVLALIGQFAAVGILTTYAFWIMLAAFVVLAAGCLFKGV